MMRFRTLSVGVLAILLGVMIVTAPPVLADPASSAEVSVVLDPGLTNIHPETGEVIELAPRDELLDEEIIILRGRDDCEYIGNCDNPISPKSDRFRGNIFRMGENGTIDEFSMELNLTASTELTFYVFEALIDDVPVFTQIWSYTYTPVGTGWAFYSSGPIMDATPESLVFVVGKDYALGVAWHDPPVGYCLSVESGTKPFSKGTIRGGTSLSKGPDDIGETETLNAFSGGFYSMEICFLPDPGACCIGLVCDDTLTATECLGESGQFAGPLTECFATGGEVECPLPTGGCCVDEVCTVLTEYQCAGAGGTWHEGTDCSDPCLCGPCGACCADNPGGPDEHCWEIMTQVECETVLLGVYRGDDASCSDFPGCNAGACCFGDVCVPGMAEAGDEYSCFEKDGIYQGPGSDCVEGQCIATGCCCFDDGSSVSDVTEAECDSLYGNYRGDFSDCATVTPPCGEGACCAEDYGCIDLDMATCANPFYGEWQGEGTICRSISPRCEGTCCWESDCNVNDLPVTPEVCTSLPAGVFMGYGVECPVEPEDPDPCDPAPASRACCLPGGTCVVATEDACLGLFGEYRMDDPDCTGVTCPSCLLDEDCDDGDLCTIDTCNTETGVCEHAPVECDDGWDCTSDFCDPSSGECVFVESCPPNDLFCDGVEGCDEFGECHSPGDPCGPDEFCDEEGDVCISVSQGDGDFDFDCDVDLADFVQFARCFDQAVVAGCEPGDMVADSVIDLFDYEQFALAFTGPLGGCGAPDGDFDNDNDVDLDDFAHFAQCFDQAVVAGCEPGDMEVDSYIDLADYTVFQTALLGPL